MDDTQDMILHLGGKVDAPDFGGWISRHAAKLGIEILSATTRPGAVVMQVRGRAELLQALELACSLGPASVLVETSTLRPTDGTSKML